VLRDGKNTIFGGGGDKYNFQTKYRPLPSAQIPGSKIQGLAFCFRIQSLAQGPASVQSGNKLTWTSSSVHTGHQANVLVRHREQGSRKRGVGRNLSEELSRPVPAAPVRGGCGTGRFSVNLGLNATVASRTAAGRQNSEPGYIHGVLSVHLHYEYIMNVKSFISSSAL
jgi:hypothetical protein